MSIPEEVIDQIFEEVKEEIKGQKALSSEEPQTFHDIEGSILAIRKRFSERLAEVALEYEGQKEQKKLSNVRRISREQGEEKKAVSKPPGRTESEKKGLQMQGL